MKTISAKSRRNSSTGLSTVRPSCPKMSDEKSTPETPSRIPRTRIAPRPRPTTAASESVARPQGTELVGNVNEIDATELNPFNANMSPLSDETLCNGRNRHAEVLRSIWPDCANDPDASEYLSMTVFVNRE